MIFNKGSKLYSIVYLKCPKCHEGNLFSARNPYLLKSMLDMPHYCPVCKQDFLEEPGFYSGALWTSYPIVIVILIIVWLVFHFLFKQSDGIGILIGSLVVLMLQPILMRVGRAIWINIFISYVDSQQ